MELKKANLPTFKGLPLSKRLADIEKVEKMMIRARDHINRVMQFLSKLPETHVEESITWLNTVDDKPLSFKNELKGKFVVVDFWSSCCINCIHVLAEMENLEKTF